MIDMMMKRINHSKMNALRRGALALVLAIGGAVATPNAALARDEEEPAGTDARLEGYQGGAKLDPSSNALNWLLLVVLAAACIGVMFMNPKRSHLD